MRGESPIVLLTRPDAVRELPGDRIAWVELKADKYHALLTGTRR